MASQNAMKLVQRISQDTSILKEIISLGDNGRRVQRIMQLGLEMDLPVDAAVVQGFLNKAAEMELSDAELEHVVGGKPEGAEPQINLFFGADGDDTYEGKSGTDIVFGNDGDDDLSGKRGDDIIFGGSGDDDISGDRGDDVLLGGSGDDNIDGGRGNDTIEGGSGDDDIDGGRGDDWIEGGSGDDWIDGGSGDDLIVGGSGNDVIDGGSGDDIIMGGTGDDVLTGGDGSDAFIYRAGDGHDTITDFTQGEDAIFLSGMNPDDFTITYDEESGNSVIEYEGGSITVEGAEVTTDDISLIYSGTDEADTLAGGGGDDIIVGHGGDDVLSGGAGNDVFVFGSNDGSDTISDFTPGEDTLAFEGADSPDDLTVTTENGNTTVQYGNTTVTLEGVEMTPDEVWNSTLSGQGGS